MQVHASLFRTTTLTGCLFACALGTTSIADTITIEPSADTTLIQNADNANGGSPGFFAGQTSSFGARRALIKFDVAGAVPAGSTITRTVLQLTVERTTSDDVNFSLHRMTGAWNEGTVAGFGGGGAPANDGDATWTHRVFNNIPSLAVPWTNAGGDFVAAASASAVVGESNTYTWGSTQSMITDVQGWLDNPAANNGWLLKAVSEVVIPTAKRFYSREYTDDASVRPKLTIEFTAGGPTCNDIDFNNDSSFFDPQDIDAFLSVYSEGPCIPASATCDGIDFNNDSSVFDPCDIDAFLLVFSEGPCTLCGV